MQNENTIYLKDYKEPLYWVEKIHLDVDLFDDHALVTATTDFKRNRSENEPFRLNGVELDLQSIEINGNSDVKYDVDETGLTLYPEEDEFTLKTVAKTNPYTNTSCEGLYQSGQILCTQNEAEGFRKITYYLDRPDVMASFTTTISADKKRFPILLCNGDLVDSGDLADNRHFTTWRDPFKKPCYLYALVAGDLAVVKDTYTTKSGKDVSLEFYVDPGNEDKIPHAMESLKKSMKWDEDTFNLEYDLSTYMIVAVDSFNMGAMENKGLNIFNSAYTLAKNETATDRDFYNIESVIGHEYFHNWTGNRVTCRDWFQLTLKEGLTVFRDQEFSSDLNSRGVKRIEDVKALRGHQFPEDAGPLSHPIRPEQYIEINNFYTATVYEKGAEVIRMIHTLIGDSNFKKGMKLYFEKFDGMAVTTEDFVSVMSEASGVDLDHFRKWYGTAGTPQVIVNKSYTDKVVLDFEQSIKGNASELLIPLSLKFFYADGTSREETIQITSTKQSFEFEGADALISMNRGFTAPITLKRSDLSTDDMVKLATLEDDEFTKYDLKEQLYNQLIDKALSEGKKSVVTVEVINFVEEILDSTADNLFKSYLLEFPELGNLCEIFGYDKLELLNDIREHFYKEVAIRLHDKLLKNYGSLNDQPKYSGEDMGIRALKNMCLKFLLSNEDEESIKLAIDQAKSAKVMTNEIAAISLLCHAKHEEAQKVVEDFSHKWKDELLVLQKWFMAKAATHFDNQLEIIAELEKNQYYDSKIPNFLRSVLGTLGMRNLMTFHRPDGSGYKYLAKRVLEIDAQNPQVASRLAKSFGVITKLDNLRKDLMKSELASLLDAKLSKDTYEVIKTSFDAV
jgi:aminopeptidase N